MVQEEPPYADSESSGNGYYSFLSASGLVFQVFVLIHHGLVVPDERPGAHYECPPQVDVATAGYVAEASSMGSSMLRGSEAEEGGQLVGFPEALDVLQFDQDGHGGEDADAWDGSEDSYAVFVLGSSGQEAYLMGQGLVLGIEVAEEVQEVAHGYAEVFELPGDGLDPFEVVLAPGALIEVLGSGYAVEGELGFDLALGSLAVSLHLVPGADQLSIGPLLGGEDIDSFEEAAGEHGGELSAIPAVRLDLTSEARDEGRWGDHGVAASLGEEVVEPEAEAAGLVDGVDLALAEPGEDRVQALEVGGQGGIVDDLALADSGDGPAIAVDIHSHEDVLSPEETLIVIDPAHFAFLPSFSLSLAVVALLGYQ